MLEMVNEMSDRPIAVERLHELVADLLVRYHARMRPDLQ